MTNTYHLLQCGWNWRVLRTNIIWFHSCDNIKNRERDYRGKERKWVGDIRKGDRTWDTPNSGKTNNGLWKRRFVGDWVTGWQSLRRVLDGISTGCYTICWQIKLQLKKKKNQGRLGGSAVERLPLAQGVIPGSWDRVSHWAPCMELASPSGCVSASLSLSLSLMNK